LLAYQDISAQRHVPLRRRLSGFGLALAVNIGLLLVLLTLGIIPTPGKKDSPALVVDLVPESHSTAPRAAKTPTQQPTHFAASKPLPKPPPIVLPSKPTIESPPPQNSSPWIEMSKEEMAGADISKLKPGAGSGGGDSEEVGRAPNGDVLYAAEWARHPTDAELGGYLPHDAPDGYGLVACKTMPEDRVDDCVELEDYPLGSHLARAVRLAAWQFRVRPPRKNGRPLIGSWVRIRIDYERIVRRDG
jgi:protein TonB